MLAYAIFGAVWLLSLALAFTLGFYIRTIVNRLRAIEGAIQALVESKTKKPPPITNKSTFLDLDDPAQRVKYEHEQLLKKLNPGMEDDQ